MHHSQLPPLDALDVLPIVTRENKSAKDCMPKREVPNGKYGLNLIQCLHKGRGLLTRTFCIRVLWIRELMRVVNT